MVLSRRKHGRNEFTGHLPNAADPVADPTTSTHLRVGDPDVRYLLVGHLVSGPNTPEETLIVDGRTVIHEPIGYRTLYRFFSKPRTEPAAIDFLRSNGLHPAVLEVLVDRDRLVRLSGGTEAKRLGQLEGLHLYSRVDETEDVRYGDAVVDIAVPSSSRVRRTWVTVDPVTARVLLETPNQVDVPTALKMGDERGEAPLASAISAFLADLPRLVESDIAFVGPVSKNASFQRPPDSRPFTDRWFPSLWDAGHAPAGSFYNPRAVVDWQTGEPLAEPWHDAGRYLGVKNPDAQNRPTEGQPMASTELKWTSGRMLHYRGCMHFVDDVPPRMATEEELRDLPPCSTCLGSPSSTAPNTFTCTECGLVKATTLDAGNKTCTDCAQ